MVEINLLPWRDQQVLSNQRIVHHRLKTMMLVCAFICVIEMMCAGWFQFKNHALDRMLTATVESQVEIQDPWLSLAEQMTGQMNHFLLLWQRIHAIEDNHIQFIRLTYANQQIIFVGKTNSFADLSRWVREMNASGLHVMVRRLIKSTNTNQVHFFVSIQY